MRELRERLSAPSIATEAAPVAVPEPREDWLDRRIAEETRPVTVWLDWQWAEPQNIPRRHGRAEVRVLRDCVALTTAAARLLPGYPDRISAIEVAVAGRRLGIRPCPLHSARAWPVHLDRTGSGLPAGLVCARRALRHWLAERGFGPGTRLAARWDAEQGLLIAEPIRDERGETA